MISVVGVPSTVDEKPASQPRRNEAMIKVCETKVGKGGQGNFPSSILRHAAGRAGSNHS